MNDQNGTVCPRCSLGRHQECTKTVLLDHTDDGESVWGECACHARGHRATIE